MFKKGFRREDGASRGKYCKRVSNEPASDSMDDDDEAYSSLDYKTPVGSKVHCVDDLADSTSRSETSFEAKNDNLQNDNKCEIQSIRSSGPNRGNAEVGTSGRVQNEALPSCFPAFHASEQGPWSAMICYEACVRLCIRSWETDCVSQASYFLNNDCVLMRNAFGLQNFFLQSEEELLANRPCILVTETTAPKFKRSVGKIELEVGRIKMGSDPLPGCNISSLKPEIVNRQIAELNATLFSGWKAVKRIHVAPQVPLNGSLSRKSLAYLRACARYLKQVSKVLKKEIVTSHTGPRSVKALQEKFSCSLRLKSSAEEDHIKTQPESGETFVLTRSLLNGGQYIMNQSMNVLGEYNFI